MKILLINGSPKAARSNTYRLSSAFVDGLRDGCAQAQLREHTVCKMQIEPCLGCFACWNRTPGTCCLQDDMAGVIGDLLWADIIIWSFPLYYFGVPGPLKNLMDRQLPMVLPFMNRESSSGGHPMRHDLSGKRHVVISTCGFYTAEGNYDGVFAMFDHMCGKGNYTAICCGQGELFRVKELSQRTDAYLSDVRQAGQEFCDGRISAETRSSLSQMLYPREVFEAMADASWGVEPSGEKSDETLVFTRQMAALYNKSAYPGRDLILEMQYTDVNRRFQIVLGKDGSQVLTDDFRSPTTVIETPLSLWQAIASGEISGEEALMQQKYRVRGDFNLMIHWDTYFGTQEQVKTSLNQKPSSMALLLIPWIAFWIATSSTEPWYAALISIAACALAPLIFGRCRILIFDRISAGFVSLLSIALIAGINIIYVLPLSYLGFGILWTVNGFTKIPLTAHYSLNDYGGENMLNNPLFLRTNRILTLCWGILYLMMTLWTVFLMRWGAGWIATANSVLPMAMSLFTVWFQKWYPAKVARG